MPSPNWVFESPVENKADSALKIRHETSRGPKILATVYSQKLASTSSAVEVKVD